VHFIYVAKTSFDLPSSTSILMKALHPSPCFQEEKQSTGGPRQVLSPTELLRHEIHIARSFHVNWGIPRQHVRPHPPRDCMFTQTAAI